MAQTLLQMCQHAADRAGIAKPTAIMGSTSDDARIMRACAQDEGEALTRRPDDGWTDMIREHTFTPGILGVTTLTIVDGLIDDTKTFLDDDIETGDTVLNLDAGTSSTVASIVNDTYLTLVDDIFAAPGAGTNYRVLNKSVEFPADYKYLVDDTLWDRSFYWELRGPLTPQKWQTYKSSVLGDTATTRRRWRIANLSGNGRRFYIDPTPTEEADLVFEYMSNAWCRSSAGVLQTAWLADTDEPVLDEYLFRLGLTWRLLDRLGLDFSTESDEYETQVAAAIGRDTGGDVLNLAGPRPTSLLTTCNVPDTGYGD